MRIKHQKIEIPKNNPFKNCKLEREPYARVLTDIVTAFSDGFVLAINNEWGAGKTTFVKMWQQQLINEGFKTIYFNAWENDFDINPLVAIMSELETLTNSKNKNAYKSILKKGAVLTKNIVPELMKAFTNKYLVEVAVDTIGNASKAATEILEEEIKEYSSKKKTIVGFRTDLENFILKSGNKKPLIFIVDELDRCRPNYSVEVLEQIKHFFSVNGIIFVLSIDKKHLSSAVKGFYGSEQIDSNEYLRRFIDIEYSIPIPQIKVFNQYLYDYYELNEFFSLEERIKSNEYRYDGDSLLKIANNLITKSNFTLRKQERIFALTSLVLNSFGRNEHTFPHLLFILIYLKTIKSDVFLMIERNEYTLQELSDAYNILINSSMQKSHNINFLYTEALLIWFYNNDFDYENKIDLLKKDIHEVPINRIKSRGENNINSNALYKYFNNISENRTFYKITLKSIINKINLTDSINTK